MRKHERFVLTELSDVMEEAVYASKTIPAGIEFYAVSDYIFQTLFMKMTGFQEQKMKCICWDLATDDFDFRREYLQQVSGLGEMSTNESKKYVYKHLVDHIKHNRSGFDPTSDLNKAGIVKKVKDDIIQTFDGSPLVESCHRLYQEFPGIYDKMFKPEYFATKDMDLLAGYLLNLYDSLYKHRNRCAHNATAYREDLPTLKQLAASEIVYESYYLRYALLLLIDEVMIALYKEI